MPEGLALPPLAGRRLIPTVTDMGAMTSVSADRLNITPGSVASAEITVRNTGHVVDSFRLEPLGALAPWMRVEPAELPLMPGTEGTVRVVFDPPRTPQLTAGEVPWGVRVVPAEDAASAIVEEGVLDIEPFSEFAADMRPRTSRARGRRSGKHELVIDNLGNTPLDVFMAGGDPDQKLDVALEPSELTLAPGAAAIVAVRPRARARFWRGQAKTYPFQVVVEPAGHQPNVVDGNLMQEAVLPAWLLKLLIALILLAAILAALWFAVLKPTIRDTASAIATEKAKAATAEEADARKAADDAAAGSADAAKEDTDAKLDKLNTALGKPIKDPIATVDPLGNPMTVRVAATKDEQAPTAVLDSKKLVSITDLLLQNANGDSGLITLRRGTDTIYQARLENFRDLDLHFVAPIEFEKGATFGLTVSCTNPDPAGPAKARPCTPAVTVQGFARARR
jgi:hypothetical protein